MKETLQQLGNPSVVVSETDRQRITELRERLVQNSRNGDQLAGMILTAAGRVAGVSVEQSNDDPTQTRQMFKKIANPAEATEQERMQIQQAHDVLAQEKDKGNQLAASILSVTDATADADIRKVKQELLAANTPDSPVAKAVAALFPEKTPVSGLPQENRVQSVSVEDYEAVRAMWKENYKNLEVPEGTDRKEWITKEGENIDRIIGLLSSQDQKQLEEGMQEVSNILPFLLLGGFSQQEIISYLKAKREAGRDVVTDIEKERTSEETLVTVDRTVSQAESGVQHMTVEVEPETGVSDSIPVGNTSIPTVPIVQVNVSSTVASADVKKREPSEAEKIAGVAVPTVSDLVKYDLLRREQDKTVMAEIEKLRDVS